MAWLIDILTSDGSMATNTSRCLAETHMFLTINDVAIKQNRRHRLGGWGQPPSHLPGRPCYYLFRNNKNIKSMIHWKYGVTCHRAKTATLRLLHTYNSGFLIHGGYADASCTPPLLVCYTRPNAVHSRHIYLPTRGGEGYIDKLGSIQGRRSMELR